MIASTKLHRLLANAKSTNDLRYEIEDYLEANCTIQEIVQLCAYAKQPSAVPAIGHLDKLDMLEALLSAVSPAALLIAWDRVLAERSQRKAQRANERAALEVPHTDGTMAQVLRLLGPFEIAALYYGHLKLIRDLQDQDQEQDLIVLNSKTRPILTRIRNAHIYRVRLDGALEWLATEDPDKAETVTEHLAGLADEQTGRMAQVIRQVIGRGEDVTRLHGGVDG